MGDPVVAAIALGGNVGDVPGAFVFALGRLAKAPGVTVLAVSSVYRTPAWGKVDQPDFLNAAALLRTSLAPEALLDLLLGIEKEAGRERAERWGPRSLDLDIITFGDVVSHSPRLTLPHRHAVERAFVLVPLAEIAPALMIADKKVSELRDGLDATDIRLDAAATARVRSVLEPHRSARTMS